MSSTRPPALQNFRKVFNELDRDHLHLVGELYTDDIDFTDPIHHIRGIGSLREYYARLYDGVEKCHFEWRDEVVNAEGTEATITWLMVMTHLRFRPGREVRMPGISHLRFRDGKVFYHHDYFDMGVMIYERVPLLGGLIRRIKGKL